MVLAMIYTRARNDFLQLKAGFLIQPTGYKGDLWIPLPRQNQFDVLRNFAVLLLDDATIHVGCMHAWRGQLCGNPYRIAPDSQHQ